MMFTATELRTLAIILSHEIDRGLKSIVVHENWIHTNKMILKDISETNQLLRTTLANMHVE